MSHNGKRMLPKDLATKCSLRPKSNREKLLLALATQANHGVPLETLAKKVYGSSRRTAPLNMVAIGLDSRLRAGRTGFRLAKEKKEGKVVLGLFRK